MFLFFLVLIQIASSGSTSATTTTKIVIGHSTEGGGSTISHFRVSLPNIHGSKQGAAKDRIYNEDSIKIEEYVSHLEDYMTNLPHFDFSSVKIEQLQLEDLTIDPVAHSQKHIYMNDLLKVSYVLVTKWHKNGKKTVRGATKRVPQRVANPSLMFVHAAESQLQSGDFRNSEFAQQMALKTGGGSTVLEVRKLQAEIQRRRKYLNKTTSSFKMIENDLKAIAFDSGFLSSLLLHATILNYDGNIKEFMATMKRAWKYFVSASSRKEKARFLKTQNRLGVCLFKAQMFKEILEIKKHLLKAQPRGQQLRTDIGLAYDAMGQFKKGAKFHTKSRKMLYRDMQDDAVSSLAVASSRPEWYLARYTRSITNYARFVYNVPAIPIDTILDQVPATHFSAYGKGKGHDGWHVSEKDSIAAMERKLPNLVVNRNHVNRVVASQLSLPEFNEKYARQGRPVLINYEYEQDSFFSKTDERWCRNNLMKMYGHLHFDVSESIEIAPSQNYAVNQSTLERVGAKKMSVKAYVKSYLDVQRGGAPGEGENGTYPYLFSTGHGHVVQDIEEPLYFKGKRFALNRRARDQKALFYIGGPGSSTYFHQHSTAYNYLSKGRKKWVSTI